MSAEVWAGLAAHSPAWGILGAIPDMNLGLVAVRLARPLGRGGAPGRGPAYAYTVDLVPLARLSPPYESLPRDTPGCGGVKPCIVRRTSPLGPGLFPAGSATGFGLSPLGLTATFRAARAVRPWAGATGGALWFDRPVPTTRATRFNFTATAEGGVLVATRRGPSLSAAYRFHHLSNAGTGRENPGVASHVVTLGAGWRR